MTGQDFLSLTGHSVLERAALRSSGRSVLEGHRPSGELAGGQAIRALELRVAEQLQMPRALVYASAAEACRSGLRMLLRAGDHVIVENDAQSAMFETVLSCGANLYRSPPGSLDGLERRLRRLKGMPGRRVVVTPALGAFTSRVADLRAVMALCDAMDARIVVDVAQDFGAMGPQGRGVLDLQECLGRACLVTGNFAGCFGAAGGFVAFQDPDLCQSRHSAPAIGLPATDAAIILAGFDLVFSSLGRRRRLRLAAWSQRLRNQLMADGLMALGQPAPFVLLRLPPEAARTCMGLLDRFGLHADLIEAPMVGSRAPRLRLQLKAGHSASEIDDAADVIRDVLGLFGRPAALRMPVLADHALGFSDVVT